MQQRTIKVWFLVHKWTSLICTLFLLMLCLTGLPLIFHDEIDHLLEGEQALPEVPDGTPMASLDEAVAAALALRPGDVPLYLSFDEDRPVVNLTSGPRVTATADEMHFQPMDLRTARPVPAHEGGVMEIILRLHKDMFAGLPGELFLGAMGVLFVLSLLSGVVVYAPFMRKVPFGTVRASRSSRLKWLDLHNMLGIVTLMWATVVGLTGVINTLATPLVDHWRGNALADLTAPYAGEPVPAALSSVQAAIDTALAAAPGNRPQFVAFPGVLFSSNHHYAVWLKGATPLTEQLHTPALVDARTGALTAVVHMPWYMTALRLSQPLHFGDYGGLPLKILWAVLDVVTIVILGSGVYLWLGRQRTSLDRRVLELEAGGAPLTAGAGR